MQLRRNQKGFSIIEFGFFMLASSFVVYCLIESVILLTKTNNQISDRSAVSDLSDRIRMSLKEKDVCSYSVQQNFFSTNNISKVKIASQDESVTISQMRFPSNQMIFQVGQEFADNKNIGLEEATLVDFEEMIPDIRYKAKMKLRFRKSAFIIGSRWSEEVIPMYIHTAPAGTYLQITGCSSSLLDRISNDDLTEINSIMCRNYGGTFLTDKTCRLPAPIKYPNKEMRGERLDFRNNPLFTNPELEIAVGEQGDFQIRPVGNGFNPLKMPKPLKPPQTN